MATITATVDEVAAATRPYELITGDVTAALATLADESVHCVVTSPPYFGLRDYGVAGQIGLEDTHDLYVEHLVAVFEEVRRVLRKDGTLWLNLGDSYAGSRQQSGRNDEDQRNIERRFERYASGRDKALSGGNGRQWGAVCPPGLKPKDLIGIPWMVAFALRDAGWYLRMDNIWSKTNPMTESVRDRPSKAHEYLFLLTKSRRYYYDADAIREPLKASSLGRGRYGHRGAYKGQFLGSPVESRHQDGKPYGQLSDTYNPVGRNKRSVWTISCRSYKGAHFATFPPKLVEPCVLAGTSERGVCPRCGTPWRRVVERERVATRPGADTKVVVGGVRADAEVIGNRDPLRHVTTARTVGWVPGCRHADLPPVPAVVLDPFSGAATTGLVALQHCRRYLGIDLKQEYNDLGRDRLQAWIDRPPPRVRRARGVRIVPLPGQLSFDFGG